MKSQIILSDHPPTIKIYEQPELKDTLSWVLVTVFIVIVILGVFFFTNPDLLIPASLTVLVIIVPFFVNRFVFKRGSVGGESFRLEKYSDNAIIYRHREFSLDQLTFEFIERSLHHGKAFLLYMIRGKEETKLRSDYGSNREDSTAYNLAKIMERHLNLNVNYIYE